AVLERFDEAADYDRLQLAARIANYVVSVRSPAGGYWGIGAGVVVAPGKVLTAAHVVTDPTRVEVAWTSPHADPSLPQTWVGPVRVLKRNETHDLALLEVPEATFAAPIAEELTGDFTKADKDWYGRKLYIVGSPLGNRGALSDALYFGHTLRYGDIRL